MAPMNATTSEEANNGDRRTRKSGEKSQRKRGLRKMKIARNATAFHGNKYPLKPSRTLLAFIV